LPEPPSTFDLPDQGDQPVVWDAQLRRFVPVPVAPAASTAAGDGATTSSEKPRQWFVGADAAGKSPPPREGGNGLTSTGAGGATRVAPLATVVAAAPDAPAAQAVVAPVAAPRPEPLPRPKAVVAAPAGGGPPAAPPKARAARGRRRRWLRVPKLRWIVAFLLLTPLLLTALGWWYANSKFNEIERIPVSSVLSPSEGGGTNYLIVGSDSREPLSAGDGPDVPLEGPEGQRSDTMLVLRTSGDGALLLSVPRDLFVTLPDGREGRINGAYNDGPAALIQTIQSNLGIPINRYLEVDFVTFSGLVDALGGITLGADAVPCAATDDVSGLNIPAGPVELDGSMALAYVRSRQYTENCNGDVRVDPTGDLGRIVRQQTFLRIVLADAGASRNPLTLLRIADSVSGGLRIDDAMSLTDAIKFAWNMGRLDPVSVELPTSPFRTSAGAAVLGLDDDEAAGVLDQFR
jgi:LCP family protein required for cell wall assembly